MQPSDKAKPAEKSAEPPPAAAELPAPVVLLTMETPWGTMTVTLNYLWAPAGPASLLSGMRWTGPNVPV